MTGAILAGIAAAVMVLGGILILAVLAKVLMDIAAKRRWFK